MLTASGPFSTNRRSAASHRRARKSATSASVSSFGMCGLGGDTLLLAAVARCGKAPPRGDQALRRSTARGPALARRSAWVQNGAALLDQRAVAVLELLARAAGALGVAAGGFPTVRQGRDRQRLTLV